MPSPPEKEVQYPLYTGHFQPDGIDTDWFSKIAANLDLYGWGGNLYNTFMAVNNAIVEVNGNTNNNLNSSTFQGLVSNTRDGNHNPTLYGTNLPEPHFNEAFLTGENSAKAVLGKVYKDVAFPFKQKNVFSGTDNDDEEAQYWYYDMYPLYWTPSRGGIIMRYTYEYKRKCVELYREGKWPETPEGVSDKSFRDKVRLWVRAEDSRGPEALKHKNFNRNWTPEERLELVSQVMSGKSCVSVAIEAGIQDRLLYQWVQNYKTKGYNGLVEMKKGRPSKGVPQMKKEEARPLNESEREELIRLRAENEYIKAENEVIKKEIALREERHAAQLKARKQRSSKSCVKKDTN